MSNYASSRLEDAGRAKLAKTVAAIWGAVGPAIMFALTWLIGKHSAGLLWRIDATVPISPYRGQSLASRSRVWASFASRSGGNHAHF